jgi:uncharacterized protein (TIGR02246 family)
VVVRGPSILFGWLCILGSLTAEAKDVCANASATDVASWFDQWNLTLASLNAEQVTQRYWQDAVLLPTSSNTPRTTPAMLREYFQHFLKKHPRARIDSRTINVGCNLALDLGTYTFALMDGLGHTSEAAGRYTFVYQYRGGAWKILHHHSSAMPEAKTGLEPAEGTRPKPGAKAGISAHAGTASPDAAGPKVAAVGGSQPFLNPDSSPNVAQFYPPEARARGEQGAVGMQVCTGPTGELNKVPEVLESSGSEALDAAAKEWANAADWIPATRQNTTIEGCTRVRIEFRLG